MNQSVVKNSSLNDSDPSDSHRPLVSPPRVNVIVTCFNYARYVVDALESVLAQTYADFDCVVVDDASTDNSFEIVEQWISSRNDNRFRLIRNERNLGQMGSLVVGLAVTEGEFVAFLDADDIWFPEFLTRHIEAHLNRAQPAGASSSDLVQIDSKGRMLVGSTMPPVFINTAGLGAEADLLESDVSSIDAAGDFVQSKSTEVKYVFASWGRWHWSMASGMVFRRPLVEMLIPSNTEALRLGADFYLMALGHSFAGSLVIKNALGAYRRHGKNNFSSLPVFGSAGSAPSRISEKAQNVVRWTAHEQQKIVYRAMLEHLLEANEQFAAAFSPPLVRKRVRTLFQHLLHQGIVVDDPGLIAVIGRRRVTTDRIKARLGLLRRKLK
jgi:glycosyltransferase involved in cell wall biosynthesis